VAFMISRWVGDGPLVYQTLAQLTEFESEILDP